MATAGSVDITPLVRGMQGLAIDERPKVKAGWMAARSVDLRTPLDWPDDKRLGKILAIVKFFMRDAENTHTIINYLWEPELENTRQLSLSERLFACVNGSALLPDPLPVSPYCRLSGEHLESRMVAHLKGTPRRDYFVALVMLCENYSVFDAELLNKHLAGDFIHPQTGEKIEKIHYFISRGRSSLTHFASCSGVIKGDLCTEISSTIKNLVLANSLEKSEEVQKARLSVCCDPKCSEEDFLHYMQLLLQDEPYSSDGLNAVKKFIFDKVGSRSKRPVYSRLQRVDVAFENSEGVQILLGRFFWVGTSVIDKDVGRAK